MALIRDIDEREMPLLDHLVELRNRLMYSAAAIILGFLICYAFADDIYAFLVRPLAEIYESKGIKTFKSGMREEVEDARATPEAGQQPAEAKPAPIERKDV